MSYNTIPKIIHQTAPANKKKWHPFWETCQKSWISQFNDFEYMLWDDEDLDKLIQESYPSYYKLYQDFGKNIILKVDFARLAILHKFGGIYTDMDFFCCKNFYKELSDNINIVGSPSPNEFVQNSLMSSPPEDDRWFDVMDKCRSRYYEFISKGYQGLIAGKDVLYISGPILVSDSLKMDDINILDQKRYNPHNNDFDKKHIYTKHYGTGKWGPHSGNRDFRSRQKLDSVLSKFYKNQKNIEINNGSVFISVGHSRSKCKTLDIPKLLPNNSKYQIVDHRYNDTFNIDIKNTILNVTRTDKKQGWAYSHKILINGGKMNDRNHTKLSIDNFSLDALLTYELRNTKKIRVGKKGDGGYCIIPQKHYDFLISGGISYDTSFEEHLLQLYPLLKGYCYDGSVNGLPVANERLDFHKLYISGENTKNTTNLHNVIEKYNDIFLKMDIEGSEFIFLDNLTPSHMQRLKQIVIEIHFPDTLQKWNILHKLQKTHYLVHVHGNNFQKTNLLSDIEKSIVKVKINPSKYPSKNIKLSCPISPTTYIRIEDEHLRKKFSFNIHEDGRSITITTKNTSGWETSFNLMLYDIDIKLTNEKTPIPLVFECTYIRKTDIMYSPDFNTQTLPSDVDYPNDGSKKDIDLNYYPFVNVY